MAKKKSTNSNSKGGGSVPLISLKDAKATSIVDNDDDDAYDDLTSKATAGGRGGTDDTTMNTDNDGTIHEHKMGTTTEVYELLQVDLGDMVKVKQILDECVAMIVLDYLPENPFYDNVKLSIMTIACIAAMVAQMHQFSNITVPGNRIILIACGCVYFFASTALQCITTFFDEDTILYTQPITKRTEELRLKNKKNNLSFMMQCMSMNNNSSSGSGSGDPSTNDALYLYYNRTTKTFTNAEPALPLLNTKFQEYGLRVRASLPKFSQYYTITLEFNLPKNTDNTTTTTTTGPKKYMVSQTWSIGQFFDHQGYFDEIGFANAIEQLLVEQLDNEQYTTSTTPTTTGSTRVNDNNEKKQK